MNISNSARSTAIIPPFAFSASLVFIRKRWLIPSVVITCLVMAFFVRQADPLGELEAAKALWAASGIVDYRIVVTFERPYGTCQLDFDVRGADIGYKHKDSCSVGGAITIKPGLVYPTVDNLFTRVEEALATPQCGPNGCLCDGPIEVTASYDAEWGFPSQITYTLRPDLRSRDLQYWLALLDGTLANCPAVTYIGQTIRVTSLEELEPLANQLTAEATKEPLLSDGEDQKPKTNP